jgi:hypothetical protein
MTPTKEAVGTIEPGVDLLSEPTFEESHVEFCRFMEAKNAGLFDLGSKYPNEFVAYFGGQVVDHGSDATALTARAAAGLGIHPARLIIYYVRVALWAE